MSLNEYKEFKRYLIGLVITVVGVAITFYFTTKFEIKDHEKRLDNLENIQKQYKSEYVSKEMNDLKLNMIINSIDEIKSDIKEIKQKK